MKNKIEFGTICTLRNGIIAISDGTSINFKQKSLDIHDYDLDYNYKNDSRYDIMKIEAYIPYLSYFEKKILWERDKKLLTFKEKLYLQEVIRPFKDRNVSIVKYKNIFEEKEKINICINEIDILSFPEFEKGKYYRNLKIDEHYSIEDLKLYEVD